MGRWHEALMMRNRTCGTCREQTRLDFFVLLAYRVGNSAGRHAEVVGNRAGRRQEGASCRLARPRRLPDQCGGKNNGASRVRGYAAGKEQSNFWSM